MNTFTNFSKCLLGTARRLLALPAENKFKQIFNNMAAENIFVSSRFSQIHNHMASCSIQATTHEFCHLIGPKWRQGTHSSARYEKISANHTNSSENWNFASKISLQNSKPLLLETNVQDVNRH